jgi:hypothetical protein
MQGRNGRMSESLREQSLAGIDRVAQVLVHTDRGDVDCRNGRS